VRSLAMVSLEREGPADEGRVCATRSVPAADVVLPGGRAVEPKEEWAGNTEGPADTEGRGFASAAAAPPDDGGRAAEVTDVEW